MHYTKLPHLVEIVSIGYGDEYSPNEQVDWLEKRGLGEYISKEYPNQASAESASDELSKMLSGTGLQDYVTRVIPKGFKGLRELNEERKRQQE